MNKRRTCRVIDADNKSVRYRFKRYDDAALREKLRELANQRRRLGFRRLQNLLRCSRKRAVGTKAPAPVLAPEPALET
jgi:hypothetical protein|tara:strand:+ start:4205 stop:4438 length:234 start_codon:yes stop_codon:yes gene_type:complete